ncbi:sensor histidine kinase KdpD [Marinilactibacillus sp. Marseille-P9653]|uniref:sensor histidine kinase n=1 Tax=Marinilactibacillus sp. Marseille-P9653 TaxID=2866583 RepID=UPI001CE4415B|nr:HAMP domain-containing sensor histidine kinase [Marinilactibacillus sp. Marseille-P9653]
MGTNKIEDIDVITRRKLVTWIVAQTLIIMSAAILSYLFVEVISNFFFNKTDSPFNFFQMLFRSGGTIIPMAIFLGMLNNALTKIVYRYIGTVADALKEIADGNFSIRLNPKKAGPFSVVYSNINKAAAELSNNELLKTNFVDHYSHEFKTPISSIKGFAELLLEDELDFDQQREYLNIIVEEASRLSDMTSTTILLSQLNTQEIVRDKKQYALDEQLRKCVILFLNEAANKNIHLENNLEKLNYYGSEELMKHVWINLLNNAFKFTPEKGSISVTLTSNEQHIIVEISDTGKGMTNEEVDQIFRQYYQVGSDQSQKGLGLGLSIVKRIIDINEGSIEVESTKQRGSKFKVYLPLKS